MKIAIDLSPIVYGSGVSTYLKNLTRQLVSVATDDQFVLFGGSLRRRHILKQYTDQFTNSNVVSKLYYLPPTAASFLFNQLHVLPIEYLTGPVDVYHASDWFCPPTRAARLVTTIHDLVPIIYPQYSHTNVVKAHTQRLAWVKKEADVIIAVSNATRQDIINHLQIPGEKVVTIYEAAEAVFHKSSQQTITQVKTQFNLPEKFILAVGTGPRKNLQALYQALVQLQLKLPLVIVGKKEAGYSFDNSHFLGQVTDWELAALYSCAEMLVLPSFYEGFGLPILEAMACGCPVVTSNLSSMSEIAGDAAVLVDPGDIDSIAQGIRKALEQRQELADKGLARAKQFSWRRAAEQTVGLYHNLGRR